MSEQDEQWTIKFTAKAKKQSASLPPEIADRLLALTQQLTIEGPVVPAWFHYGKLRGKKNTHHCHLNKGKPRYVAVWFVHEKQIQLMEVTYVGTHENAPY